MYLNKIKLELLIIVINLLQNVLYGSQKWQQMGAVENNTWLNAIFHHCAFRARPLKYVIRVYLI